MANQPKRYPTFYSRAFVPSKKFDNVLIPPTLKAKQLFNYQGVAFFVVTYSLQ